VHEDPTMVSKAEVKGKEKIPHQGFLEGISRKSSTKSIKQKAGVVKMVVGEDIFISEVSKFVGKMLMGIFWEKSPREKALSGWIENQWKPLLGYTPKAHLMSRGWILFLFQSNEDSESIHKREWSWGPLGLSIKT
jgi:hypothetical protein